MSGWFAISRSIFDHPIFKGHPERIGAWVWLVGNAAWKDTRQDANGKTVTVKRGQILTSYRQMSSATGVSIKALRILISRLRQEHAIGTDTGTGRLLITICNYEKYQAKNSEGAQLGAREGHSEGTQKKQGNKGTREAKASHTRDAREKTPEGFDAFWQEVPRKVAKATAVRAYRKALKSASPDVLKNAMRGYARSVQGKEEQFVVHPATWLNGERWNDQPHTEPNVHRLRPSTPQPGEIREIRGQRHVYRAYDGWVPEYA